MVRTAIKNYVFDVAKSLDQTFLNVIPGPLWNGLLYLVARYREDMKLDPPDVHWFGDPDEYASSVLGKNKPWCAPCRWICAVLSKIFGERTHCTDAIEADEGRKN